MSLNKETKIRVLENFYAIDYIFFGKPLKSIKLAENDECEVCNQALIDEYVTAKGALLSTVIEMYRLVEHTPSVIKEKVTTKSLSKMAVESAKLARQNAVTLIKEDRAKKDIKDRLVETITKNENVDVETEVKSTIREKAYSLALDNLLVARTINESKNYKELNSWLGRIIEDAYKVLRDSIVESAVKILKKKVSINEAEPAVKIGPVKKGELELPKGKDVDETSEEHFKNLIKKDGWEKVSKRINTLHVWNKNKNPELAAKMDALQAKLSKWVESKRKEDPDFAS